MEARLVANWPLRLEISLATDLTGCSLLPGWIRDLLVEDLIRDKADNTVTGYCMG